MLGIDSQLEELYEKAQNDGEAILKDRWTAENYNCCSTRAPLIEKYKIVHTSTEQAFYIWRTLVVSIDPVKQQVLVNQNYEASNYDKKVIDWFIQRSKQA